jgi:succinate dehydrogenase / fumarate reductase, cytochrome b subunit
MADNKKRPVFLNLFKIRLPVPGVTSILHRASGVLLVLALPLLLYGLDRSLSSAEGFGQVAQWLKSPAGCLVFFLLVAAFAQHFAAGLRHLLLSIGYGLTPTAAVAGAWATIVFTLLVVATVAFVIW